MMRARSLQSSPFPNNPGADASSPSPSTPCQTTNQDVACAWGGPLGTGAWLQKNAADIAEYSRARACALSRLPPSVGRLSATNTSHQAGQQFTMPVTIPVCARVCSVRARVGRVGWRGGVRCGGGVCERRRCMAFMHRVEPTSAHTVRPPTPLIPVPPRHAVASPASVQTRPSWHSCNAAAAGPSAPPPPGVQVSAAARPTNTNHQAAAAVASSSGSGRMQRARSRG